MARKAIDYKTIKQLMARSGNICAYPECDHPIFDDDGNFIAQLCHINAAEKGGQRYEHFQTDDERRSYENLLFLCYRHHIVTNNTEKYPTSKMLDIKHNHEKLFTEGGRAITTAMIWQIQNDVNDFWKKQEKKLFIIDELKMKVNRNNSILDIFGQVEEDLNSIEEYCDFCAGADSRNVLYQDLEVLFKNLGLEFSTIDNLEWHDNPFFNRNWEMHALWRNNSLRKLHLHLAQLKLKVAEELLRLDPTDLEIKNLILKLRSNYDFIYDNTYYAD